MKIRIGIILVLITTFAFAEKKRKPSSVPHCEITKYEKGVAGESAKQEAGIIKHDFSANKKIEIQYNSQGQESYSIKYISMVNPKDTKDQIIYEMTCDQLLNCSATKENKLSYYQAKENLEVTAGGSRISLQYGGREMFSFYKDSSFFAFKFIDLQFDNDKWNGASYECNL